MAKEIRALKEIIPLAPSELPPLPEVKKDKFSIGRVAKEVEYIIIDDDGQQYDILAMLCKIANELEHIRKNVG